jgi:hypothetical protein
MEAQEQSAPLETPRRPYAALAVLGASGVAALVAQNKKTGDATVVTKAPAAMVPFSAAEATRRAAEAEAWIVRFRTTTQVKVRAAEAEAWVAAFRSTTAARERNQRVHECSLWIANWRARSSAEGSGGSSPGGFFASLRKALFGAFAATALLTALAVAPPVLAEAGSAYPEVGGLPPHPPHIF